MFGLNSSLFHKTPIPPSLGITSSLTRFMTTNHTPSGSISTQPHTLMTIIPPWECDTWRSKLSRENVDHLHRALRHQTGSSLTNIFCQRAEGRKLPCVLKDLIKKQKKAANTPKMQNFTESTKILSSLQRSKHRGISGRHAYIVYKSFTTFLVMSDYRENTLK